LFANRLAKLTLLS